MTTNNPSYEEAVKKVNELIDKGNDLRSQTRPWEALRCYAEAFLIAPECSAAWNNYGNVMRECGYPRRSLPFLQEALAIEPDSSVAAFNVAVAQLLMGDYTNGWKSYETRWNYEHLAGTLPKFEQPRWEGQDLKDKTILLVGEQGHGDTIQFIRFAQQLHAMGANIKLQCTSPLIPLFVERSKMAEVFRFDETPHGFDYWIPLMSLPRVLGITLENLELHQFYLTSDKHRMQAWFDRLGPKKKTRIGVCWSGRPDSWLNQHKSIPFEHIEALVKSHPEHDWINLQVHADDDTKRRFKEAGGLDYSENIADFADTGALMQHLDIVLTVDTSIAHLSGALGRPTWIMLQNFALDWRWLLERRDSPWYKTAKLFRQPSIGDWGSVIKEVEKFLSWFKV